jgi:uncharacterized membrane protein YtjA (UPF0391 family)
MLRWSMVLLIVALIAGLFGFTPAVGETSEMAKTLFFVFLVLFVVSLLFDGRAPKDAF